MTVRSLQIAVLTILDQAANHEWSVQGFGMLRLYVRSVGRLHLWDSRLRYPNVSMIHNHAWDLRSVIVAGQITNTRYKREIGNYPGNMYRGKRLVTGFETTDVRELTDCALMPSKPEIYAAGMVYEQHAKEIHQTDAIDGTITIMERDDTAARGEADVYWPVNEEFGTAQPRKATAAEVKAVVGRAIFKLEDLLRVNIAEGVARS